MRESAPGLKSVARARSPARALARPSFEPRAKRNTAARCCPWIVMNAGRVLLNSADGKPQCSKSYRRAKRKNTGPPSRYLPLKLCLNIFLVFAAIEHECALSVQRIQKLMTAINEPSTCTVRGTPTTNYLLPNEQPSSNLPTHTSLLSSSLLWTVSAIFSPLFVASVRVRKRETKSDGARKA